jgi:hypothetical protein
MTIGVSKIASNLRRALARNRETKANSRQTEPKSPSLFLPFPSISDPDS